MNLAFFHEPRPGGARTVPIDATPRADDSKLQTLLVANKRDARAGTVLRLEGENSDTIYCVLSGWLATSKSLHNGDRQIVNFVLPGDLLDPSSADPRISAVQLEATSYAVFAAMPKADWALLRRKMPALRDHERAQTAAGLARLSERILRLGKGTAETRVAYALLELGLRLRAIDQVQGRTFHVPLTQQQLGDYVGLSSVHVCRTMRRMVTNGILSMRDHMDIRIHDIHALCALAGAEMEPLDRLIIPPR